MIKGIQLLRAIAALAVVFVHCHFHSLETGTFGVDIFFIISGFIIAFMVNQTTKQFIINRIARISPLYFLATLLTLVLALIKPQWFNHVTVTTETVVKSFLYIPYQIGGGGPILSSGWTLNNEMFFYEVMFLCILIFKKKKHIVPACALLLILLLIILHCFSKDFISAYSNILRFYRNGLLPEFIYGLALYYFWSYYNNHKIKVVNILMVTTGLAVFALMIYLDLNQGFQAIPRNIHYGIPCLLFVNIFLVLENRINEKNRIIKTGLKLGDASYAMYLFHPFVIHLLLKLVYPKIIGSSKLLTVELAELIFTIILVIVVSVLIYEFVDRPLNKFIKKRIKKYNDRHIGYSRGIDQRVQEKSS